MSISHRELYFDPQGDVFQKLLDKPAESILEARQLFDESPTLMHGICELASYAYPVNPLNQIEAIERQAAFNAGALISINATRAALPVAADELVTLFLEAVPHWNRPHNSMLGSKYSRPIIASCLEEIPELRSLYDAIRIEYSPEPTSRSNIALIQRAAGYGLCCVSRGLMMAHLTLLEQRTSNLDTELSDLLSPPE